MGIRIKDTKDTSDRDHFSEKDRRSKTCDMIWYSSDLNCWGWWHNSTTIKISERALSSIYKSLGVSPTPNRKPLPGGMRALNPHWFKNIPLFPKHKPRPQSSDRQPLSNLSRRKQERDAHASLVRASTSGNRIPPVVVPEEVDDS